jgi:alkylation response protein AidB-like acyl-CoA dehydrogenase
VRLVGISFSRKASDVLIGPTADQLALRENMREVLAAECPRTLVRQTHTDSSAWRHLWKTVLDLGWTALARPGIGDDDLGLSTLDVVLALETCGAVLAPIPFVSSVGLAAGVARAGGAATAEVLDEIVNGNIATLAAQPAAQRLPGPAMMLREGRIQGSAVAVPDAMHADRFVVLCTQDDRVIIATFRCGPGVTITPAVSIDPSRTLATLTVDARPEHLAEVTLGSALAPAWLAVAAELVGVAQGALDLAVTHACTRRQFDRLIGSYQGVKHALADNLVALERARSLVYLAAARLDDQGTTPPEVSATSALAKAAASDAALGCARTTIQVLGALGQTWEHDAHLYMRRAWLGAALLGDSSSLYHNEGQRFLTGTPQ